MTLQWGVLSQRATWAVSTMLLLQSWWGAPGIASGPAPGGVKPLADASDCGSLDALEGSASAVVLPDAGVVAEPDDLHANAVSRVVEGAMMQEADLVLPRAADELRPDAARLEIVSSEPLGLQREHRDEEVSVLDNSQWPDRGGDANAAAASLSTEPAAGSSNDQSSVAANCANGNSLCLDANAADRIQKQSSSALLQEPEPSALDAPDVLQAVAGPAVHFAANGRCPSAGSLRQQCRLEFEGVDNLPSGSGKPITVRGIVSEWLASGHEVVTVKL